MGTSPQAQRAKRREVVTDPGPTPEVNLPSLAQEVHRLHAQSAKDAAFFDDTHDQINDHADCLLLLKKQILSLRDNIAQVSKDVLANDAELKEKAKQQERETKANQPGGKGEEPGDGEATRPRKRTRTDPPVRKADDDGASSNNSDDGDPQEADKTPQVHKKARPGSQLEEGTQAVNRTTGARRSAPM